MPQPHPFAGARPSHVSPLSRAAAAPQRKRALDRITSLAASLADPRAARVVDALFHGGADEQTAAAALSQNGVSFEAMCDLTEGDLKTLGVSKLGPRKRALSSIETLCGAVLAGVPLMGVVVDVDHPSPAPVPTNNGRSQSNGQNGHHHQPPPAYTPRQGAAAPYPSEEPLSPSHLTMHLQRPPTSGGGGGGGGRRRSSLQDGAFWQAVSRTTEEEGTKIEDALAMLRADRGAFAEVLPMLPDDLVAQLTGREFLGQCAQTFDDLDTNRDGVLSPAELHPVVLSLADADAIGLTLEHCERFTSLFDTDDNGVISRAEFAEFSQFLVVMAFLESKRTEGRKIDEALVELQADSSALETVFPLLPESLLETLGSAEFHKRCDAEFAALDIDRSGTLTPDELFPIVLDLADADAVGITYEHCERLAVMFDANGDGVISRDEFVVFSQYLLAMRWLELRRVEAELEELEVARRRHRRRRSRRRQPTPSSPSQPSSQSQPLPSSLPVDPRRRRRRRLVTARVLVAVVRRHRLRRAPRARRLVDPTSSRVSEGQCRLVAPLADSPHGIPARRFFCCLSYATRAVARPSSGWRSPSSRSRQRSTRSAPTRPRLPTCCRSSPPRCSGVCDSGSRESAPRKRARPHTARPARPHARPLARPPAAASTLSPFGRTPRAGARAHDVDRVRAALRRRVRRARRRRQRHAHAR